MSHYFLPLGFIALVYIAMIVLNERYGLFAAVSCLIEAGVLWQIAAFARRGVSGIRSLVAVFFLGEVGYAVLVLKYFFLVPIISHFTMAALLILAFMTAESRLKAAPAG